MGGLADDYYLPFTCGSINNKSMSYGLSVLPMCRLGIKPCLGIASMAGALPITDLCRWHWTEGR